MFGAISREEQARQDDADTLERKVMIVDDQGFNIDAALVIFNTKLKFDTEKYCSLAYDGQEAFDKVVKNVEAHQGRNCSYELILMDCNMPFVDGYMATEKIREYLYSRGLEQPIITAATGHCEPDYIRKALKVGMNQVMSKPL